ncbi:MAG: hypothetical protein NTV77_01715 [Candidatus Azambacteria bacterium]|nr:hypothetical protein [Candidatus Azambacteria bacterium]
MNRKTKIVIVIVLAVILALAGYFGYKKYFNKPELENKNLSDITILPNKPSQTKDSELKSSVSKTIATIAGFKLYKNIDFGFEIQYPDSWTVSEESIVNVRGENTKGFFFKKPNSDLRFAILPRDGLSYGLPNNGTSSQVFIGGFPGAQTKWTLPDGKRLWLLHPQYGLFNWSEDIGRIDILSSVTDPAGDIKIFEEMLNSFKLSK